MDKYRSIFSDAFPNELESDINSILGIMKLNNELHSNSTFEVIVGGEKIHIPERIYHEEPTESEEIKMTAFQRQILNCFFTRHHNGYVRQRRLRSIFDNGNVEKWMIPYILRLTGEYVEGIINDIYLNIDLIDVDNLKDFINNNKYFIKLTEDRIASYWNEYHRWRISRDEYSGYKIKKTLNSLTR